MPRLKSFYCICVIISFSVVTVTVVAAVEGFRKEYENTLVTECQTPNHQSGYCIGIRQCEPLFKKMKNKKWSSYLRRFQCGPKNQNAFNPKVCCAKSNFKKPDKAQDDIFPKACGQQKVIINRRIIGGKEASLGEYPWMARLFYRNKYGYRVSGCSGFLIHPRFVVTAAHCTQTDVKGPIESVVLGEHNVTTEIDCNSDGSFCADPIQNISVAKVLTHGKYDGQTVAQHYDIAILYLKEKARLSKFVQPICLLKNETQIPARYYLSGWGKTEKGNFKTSSSVTATHCETPNNESAYCVEIEHCDILFKQIKNNETSSFIRDSHCGPSNENVYYPKVCCGKYDNYKNITMDNVSNVNTFPKICGMHKVVPLQKRIIGGNQAYPGEYPWMARLIYEDESGIRSALCAGFLVHVKFVITAAHCTHPMRIKVIGKIVAVVLGEHNETETDCSSGEKPCAITRQTKKVINVITHPNYIFPQKSRANDIAIIHIQSSLLSDFVQPICLPKSTFQVSTKYYLSGWGTTENKQTSNIKMKVEIIPFNAKKCKEKYSLHKIMITDSQICAGGEDGKDSCNGDSGGPLMMVNDDEIWYAVGIVSFGMGCGQKGWPGVYTNVVKFLPWIHSEITASMHEE